MTMDLKEQIRHLASLVETDQWAVTVDEVRLRIDRDETEPVVGRFAPRPALRSGRRRWMAVLAAVAVIVLFGALALLLPGDEPVPPADTVAPLPEGAPFKYWTSSVPDGFVVQRVGTVPSGLTYVGDFDGTWTPSDGGVFLDAPFESRFGAPDDVEVQFATVLDAVPGATRVDLEGRPAIVFESTLEEWSTPLVWVLGADGQGGTFEMGTTGLSREEALDVAAGVKRISVDDYLSLGNEISWDLSFYEFTRGAEYNVPDMVTDLATDVHVAVGLDALRSRLAHADQSQPVVTTETGEVVESDGQPITGRNVDVFIEASDDAIEQLLQAYPDSELSPPQHSERLEAYIEMVRGPILSNDPYVTRATPGPEPEFDISQLGTELPIEPATSIDVVPDELFGGFGYDLPVATEERPILVLGTASEPDSERPGVVALVWFSEEEVVCEGTTDGDGLGTGCGFEIQVRFGLVSGSSGAPGGGGDDRFQVPLETSVVQIVTPSGSYWQRPVGGWVIVPYGDTVQRSTNVVAFDAQGEELGSWET